MIASQKDVFFQSASLLKSLKI